jgi:haloalkane dehalogenase
MTNFVRTPDENFAELAEFSFEPHYHQWHDLRMHYLDEGPADGPVVLLVHGMPTWSYLYRTMIPSLVAAGYRCIAPDHLGFGRSDKPTDLHWYSIARHVEVLSSLVTTLDLRDVTLVCQDWGGPTGLAQAATMPDRFRRLVIMNTWLHHDAYEYSDAIRNWNRNWYEGGIFSRERPEVGLLLPLTAGLATPQEIIPAIAQGIMPELSSAAASMHRGFAAPYRGLDNEAFNGLRRFPTSIPLDGSEQPSFGRANAAAQTLHYRTLLAARIPSTFIWGGADDIFTEAWGRTWAEQMNATFDVIPEAGHFLQNTHGPEIVEIMLRRFAAA